LLLLQTPGGNILFRNNGNGKFAKILNVDLNESDDPTSVVNGDFNNDGLLDVVVGDGDNGRQNGDSIFINTGGEGNNFLILTLEGTQSNRSGIGAKVLVRVGLVPQLKEVSAGNGKNQESLPLEFGLGSSTQAASVQVFWPSGVITNLVDVPAGRRTIVEGQ
jgi:ASPIC and UnbV/FG-GAP-like repeat